MIRRRKRQPAGLSKHRKQVHEADRLFSLYIRQRDGRCAVCSATDGLQCMHLISRRYKGTRWLPDNAVAGCQRCHMKYTYLPLEWDEWCENRLGSERWAALKLHARTVAKPELDLVILLLKSLLQGGGLSNKGNAKGVSR